jgi:hypothetical protein
LEIYVLDVRAEMGEPASSNTIMSHARTACMRRHSARNFAVGQRSKIGFTSPMGLCPVDANPAFTNCNNGRRQLRSSWLINIPFQWHSVFANTANITQQIIVNTLIIMQ